MKFQLSNIVYQSINVRLARWAKNPHKSTYNPYWHENNILHTVDQSADEYWIFHIATVLYNYKSYNTVLQGMSQKQPTQMIMCKLLKLVNPILTVFLH